VKAFADGDNVLASGTAAKAVGLNARALGVEASAEGQNVTATGTGSRAVGTNTRAQGVSASADGQNATASGTGSRAIGFNAIAQGVDAYAEGRNVVALGTGATALGYNTNVLAMGTDSFADGSDVTAIGSQSSAVGVNTLAVGTGASASSANSMAIGYQSLANNFNAIAIGPDSKATAVNSMAVGGRSSAEFYQSTALGYKATTKRDYEVAVGTSKSIYRMPGLAGSNGSGFVGSRYQNYGKKKFVTSDDQGTLGTSSFSVNELVDSVGAVGALSASLSAIPQTTLLPDENLRCGIGTGGYGNQWAGSLGCAVKLKKRAFLNAGLASTPTQTIGGSIMGRVGFSIGFGGGSSSDEQHEQLSRLPNVSPTSTSMLMEGGMDVPFLDAEEESAEMIAYKTQEPAVISAIEPTHIRPDRVAMLVPNSSSDSDTKITELRELVSTLESRIIVLSKQSNDQSDSIRLQELESLLEAKRKREEELSLLLQKLDSRVKDQELMLEKQQILIDRLLSESGLK
jgi:hypothetical protein